MTRTLNRPGVDLARMLTRRHGDRAPPAPHQMLAVATRHPTLSTTTHEYWDGACRVASESRQREVVLRSPLQSNCTPRAQFLWSHLAVFLGKILRDMMWTSPMPGTGQLPCTVLPAPPNYSTHSLQNAHRTCLFIQEKPERHKSLQTQAAQGRNCW